MRAPPLAAALAVAAAMLGAQAGALAAPPGSPSAADVASARRLFETGLKLYNEGSYREALAAFEHANSLAPRASIQRNIAQCHRDLKDFAAAYDAYEAMLTKYGATLSAADKRSVQRAIEELSMLTGAIRVAVTEPGATVTLDGQVVGTTPLATPVRVNLGPHTVAVSKPGFETIQKDVKLSGGDEWTVEGPLQPEVTTGHLVVSAPGDAKVEVFVDGADVGPAPWEGDVKPGVHVVEARGKDRFAQPKQVDVERRARVEMALELAGSSGRVQIDTHTADASIAVDGQPLGRGVWEGPMAAGEHQVTIEAPGYRTYKAAFLVHPGETFVEDARLVSESGPAAVRYEGIYSGLAFLGYATVSGATNGLAQSCPAPPCDTPSPLGVGLMVRVGYSFGWIGVEGLVLGSYDHTTASVAYGSENNGPPRTESYDFHRFGGGGAIGVRVASKHPHVRFTGGVFGGVVERGNLFKRIATESGGMNQTDEYTSDTISYTAPILLLDAGVLAGWANGAKFHVGVVGLFEFVGGAVNAPAPASVRHLDGVILDNAPTQLVAGTQVFVGPMVGLDFGM